MKHDPVLDPRLSGQSGLLLGDHRCRIFPGPFCNVQVPLWTRTRESNDLCARMIDYTLLQLTEKMITLIEMQVVEQRAAIKMIRRLMERMIEQG